MSYQSEMMEEVSLETNTFVHDVINLLYHKHWTDKRRNNSTKGLCETFCMKFALLEMWIYEQCTI